MEVRTRCSVEVQRLVRGLLWEGYNSSQIFKRLETIHDENPQALGFEEHLPSDRTIDRLVKQMKPFDPSGPWTFLNATPNQQRLVPEVWSHVYYETEGRVRLSNDLAELVTQVRLSCPDIPLDWAYRCASMLQTAKNDPELEFVVIVELGQRRWEKGDTGLDSLEQLEEGSREAARWKEYFEQGGILEELEEPEYVDVFPPMKFPPLGSAPPVGPR